MQRQTFRGTTLRNLILGLAMVLSGAGSLRAESLTASAVGDQMYFGGWSGGSFTAHATGPSGFQDFQTFCAEAEGIVYVDAGSSFKYQILSIGLLNDGDDQNALTEHTAWLYTAFLNQTLPNYVSDLNHEKAVQYGVWHSLGYSDAELASLGDLNTQARADYFAYGWDATPGTWSGYGSIRIAQMQYMTDSSPAQDILVNVVPEPASLSLLALGGVTLLWRSRRRK